MLGRDDLDHPGSQEGLFSKAQAHKQDPQGESGLYPEQLAPGSGISIQYVDTNLQAADIFTKALLPQKWDNALKLLGIRQSLPEVLEDQRRLPTKLVPKAKVAASGATVVSRHTSYRSNG